MDLYGLLLSVVILVVQHFLSRRNSPVWGAVLPVAYIGLFIWLFSIKNVELDTIFIIGVLVLLGI
ncbi:MAG: hypothetical protein ACI4XL_04720 [Bacillus sp. (in: firmicutes)]